MTHKVTVVFRTDDVLVRRNCLTVHQAFAVWTAVTERLHAHWCVMRDRKTGGTISWRAS